MVILHKGLPALGVLFALACLCLALPAAAAPADKNGTPEASEPNESGKNAAGKPDEASKKGDAAKDEGKPDEGPPPDEKAAEAPPVAGQIQSGVKMKDLLAEGFLVRTTVLVPAEAVTRQIGKVSSDAILLTLQKESAIAVCYYTLKAYVKEGLTDIASCTVFR